METIGSSLNISNINDDCIELEKNDKILEKK
jgi:hypothetical protein